MLEFLIENPVIIIFLLMGLSSLFTKQKAKPHSGPETEPINIPREVEREVIKPKPLIPSEQIPKSKPYEEWKTEVYENIPTQVKIEESHTNRPEKTEEINHEKTMAHLQTELQDLEQQLTTKKKVLKTSTGNLNRTKIMEAIVWSEILGPPRAKKPYRSMNHRQ